MTKLGAVAQKTKDLEYLKLQIEQIIESGWRLHKRANLPIQSQLLQHDIDSFVYVLQRCSKNIEEVYYEPQS